MMAKVSKTRKPRPQDREQRRLQTQRIVFAVVGILVILSMIVSIIAVL
jgi:predicted nucleic acid-binding Zn ribbon protein